MHESYKKWLDDGCPKVFCQCGCKEEIIIKEHHKRYGIPKYISGHAIRLRTPEERKRIGRLISGDKNPAKRPEVREKISKTLEGHEVSEETRRKNGEGHKGLIPWIKGKHHTEEAKQKNREKHLGRPLTEEHKKNISVGLKNSEKFQALINNPQRNEKISKKNKGKTSWLKGKNLPEETKKKISIANSGENNGMYNRTGDLNPAWLGGESFKPYHWKFNESLKREIRKRDNHICQKCGKTQKDNKRKLTVHHIDYDKMNSCPTNLISLCTCCNSRVNTNRNEWMEFFMNLLYKRFSINKHFNLEGDI